jgi:hypothetical protein
MTTPPDERQSQQVAILVTPRMLRRLDMLRDTWSLYEPGLSRADVVRSLLDRELPTDSKRTTTNGRKRQ